ncbi:MAG TPA: hypothetical protein VG389_07745 [Myxococcota bacterium]|jgi:hypothetical protein|nr:hypothetical protein [Myxococcota bacterium]
MTTVLKKWRRAPDRERIAATRGKTLPMGGSVLNGCNSLIINVRGRAMAAAAQRRAQADQEVDIHAE